MEITIYELLGMIKDGKAPYKIKYLDKYYTYVKEDYEDEEENQLLSWLFQDYCVEYVLDEKVSIPFVESKENKIQKLNKPNGYSAENYIDEMFDKINIDVIQKDISKLNGGKNEI